MNVKGLLKYSLLLLLPLILLSCNKKEGNIIPRDTLSEIYADMFVTDQLLYHDIELRRMADTSWVYEPILQEYGYTVEDFRLSMIHYLNDSDRYARILKQTGILLEERLKELKKEQALNESANRMKEGILDFKPERIFCLTGLGNRDLMMLDSLAVYVDSTGGEFFFDTNAWADTICMAPLLPFSRHEADSSVTIGEQTGIDGKPLIDSTAVHDLKLSGIHPKVHGNFAGKDKNNKPKTDEKGFSKISLYN